MPTIENVIAERALPDQKGFVGVEPTTDNVFASAVKIEEEQAARWTAIIDQKLIEWGRNSNNFQAEGLIGPSNNAIQKALSLLRYMRNSGWHLPSGVIPDGEGGIVFENRRGATYQRVEIDANGAMWLATFENCTLKSRDPVDVD
jgi:hypothetical protein